MSSEQKKRLLIAKVAVALQSELGRVPKEVESHYQPYKFLPPQLPPLSAAERNQPGVAGVKAPGLLPEALPA
jgi:hypothetical protein